ncbi:structural maintenance of chromosomes protein 5, putative [Plasmodium ovale]|uniref:Structural maintenance of chromosomes protein 5 n=1 Tax=Plasmodium ovale TaxID=36330 RepID=A0A1D3TI10_PLAOA|nr:structural maintenance of chromosomes protein 5, putative [Plasmodium ovale]
MAFSNKRKLDRVTHSSHRRGGSAKERRSNALVGKRDGSNREDAEVKLERTFPGGSDDEDHSDGVHSFNNVHHSEGVHHSDGVHHLESDNNSPSLYDSPRGLKKGSLKEVRLYNWMVFSGPVRLVAADGINLIAAANASGKSSIVCALVFGLGYGPNILSRNKELSNFIKKGEKRSYIEITLKTDEEKDICIRRIMHLTKEDKVETLWIVNEKKVNYTYVVEIQKEFSLSLDNLITFMPQENVSKFSRLSPEELFEHTMSAIDRGLVHTYRQLKEIINEKKIGENKLLTYEHDIAEIEKVITNLEGKKTQFDNVRKLLATVKLYRVKKTELTAIAKKEEMKKVGEYIDSLVKEKDAHFDTLRYYLLEVEKCHRIIGKLSERLSEKREEVRNCIKQYVLLNVQLEEAESEIAKEEKAMQETVRRMYENREYVTDIDKKVKKTKEEIKKIEEYFTEKNEQGEKKTTEEKEKSLQEELKVLSNMGKQLLMSRYTLQSEYNAMTDKIKKRRNYENIQEEKMLNSIEFTLRERIVKYKRDVKNIVQTHNLLSDTFIENLRIKYDESKIANQNEFNDAIIEELSRQNILYGPICKYIKCTNPQFDYVVEFCLKKYLNSFLLIRKDNKDLLEDLYRKYKLSVLTMSRDNHNFCFVTNEMRKRGVQCFVYEIIDSPEVVKNGLVNFLPLNISFIVNDDTFKDKNTKEIKDFNEFMLREISTQMKEEVTSLFYFCNNNVHRYKISSYDKNVYIDNFSYIDKRCKILYHISSDVQKDLLQLYEKQKKCHTELELLEKNIKILDDKKKEKNDEYNKLLLSKSEMNIMKKKLTLLKGELKDLENSLHLCFKGENIIEEKKNNVTVKVNQINNKKICICEQYFSLLKMHTKYDKEVVSLSRKLNQWKRYLHVIKGQNAENEEKHETLKRNIQLERTKLTTYMHEIEELEEIIKFQKGELTKGELKTLNSIDMTMDDIEEKLQECNMKQKIYGNLEKDEEKYNIIIMNIKKHNEYVKKKKIDMENVKRFLIQKENEIENVLPSWSNKINEYITFLNHNFEMFMFFINPNYGGKIELVKKNNLYEMCQLFIKVRFTNTSPFLPLSVSHQSGGERSLSTMLYILSIQKLTKNGFYVLDELNQGLDQTNERKIFELLSCLSNPILYKKHFQHHYEYKYVNIDYQSKAQYFILTPQVIKNISFRDITVHYLFNGFGVLDDQFAGFCHELPTAPYSRT